MQTVKILTTGGTQTVALPEEFHFATTEVSIRREGNAVILEPIDATWDWLDALAGPLDADFIAAALEKQPEQHRPELDNLFPPRKPRAP